MDDNWIEWNGGECPVEGDVTVEIRLRGSAMGAATGTAVGWDWRHVPEEEECDIVAYRVVTA